MIDSIEKSKCTGCKMCADVCPKNAIYFECDEQGFWYPKINYSLCVKCNICTHKCPSLNMEKVVHKDEPVVYSAWSKNEDTRISSTSGGAFYEIAKYFIEQDGVVVGSKYSEDWKSAKHVIAYDLKGLQKIKGSKYFQSDTKGIYKKVEEELKKGRLLLFCGTPCQNAALSSYLGKEYSNLYYMDFICRSINSPLAFKKYISELERKFHSKVVKVHLKNKKYGWHSLASQVCFENGKEYIHDKNKDWWVKGFIYNDLYTRESCYHCPYKVLPRTTADISIGDFWGIKGQSESDMFKGISAILLNSKKGIELFEQVKNNFIISRHSLEELLFGNPALLKNPVKTKKQDTFFRLLDKHSFSYCVKKCTKSYIFIKILKKVFHIYKRLKKISIIKYIYYNYFCKNIIRDKESKVIPYKNAIVQLGKNSKIYLHGKNLEIGFNKLEGSKAETHIRMDENSIWHCNNGCLLFYNTVLEVKPNAILDTGFFSANGGSVIIADKHITLGEDVMIGRNVIIYDSDFHQLRNKIGIPYNSPKEVIIEDHVWLTSNITVLKGVRIGKDSLITAQTVINKDTPKDSIIGANSTGKIINDRVNWNRQRCEI